MDKMITGILLIFLIVGIMNAYIPNAFASSIGVSSDQNLEICSGHIAPELLGGSSANFQQSNECLPVEN